jgi:hypothetical protein
MRVIFLRCAIAHIDFEPGQCRSFHCRNDKVCQVTGWRPRPEIGRQLEVLVQRGLSPNRTNCNCENES